MHGTSLVALWIRIHMPLQRTWFDPWSGKKIPHATEQLSPSTTTTESYMPQILKPAPPPTACMPPLLKPKNLEPVL